MAQAQLDDPDTCDSELIGTGPYMLTEWEVNDHLTVERNPDYWRTDAQGEQLPYLDGITFRPVPDAQTRVNGLLAGEYDIAMTSSAPATETLEAEAESGNINLVQSSVNAEVGFMMFNESHPPFDDPAARQAVATALDRKEYNEVVSLGLLETASGPFPPGAPGYLEDAGFPSFDLERAKELVADYESRTGSPLEFTYSFSSDEDNQRSAQFIQGQLEAAGMKVNLKAREQATLISTALGDDWDAMAFRNFPGGFPDGNYVWWYSSSPVNLGQIDDPELDALLDAGRSELDDQASDAIYEDLNRRMAEQVHFAWLDWTLWTIATQPDIHGIQGATLPDGSQPSEGLATGHATSGIYRTG
jgi:peptide/nickel transport system substrate-binding protein